MSEQFPDQPTEILPADGTAPADSNVVNPHPPLYQQAGYQQTPYQQVPYQQTPYQQTPYQQYQPPYQGQYQADAPYQPFYESPYQSPYQSPYLTAAPTAPAAGATTTKSPHAHRSTYIAVAAALVAGALGVGGTLIATHNDTVNGVASQPVAGSNSGSGSGSSSDGSSGSGSDGGSLGGFGNGFGSSNGYGSGSDGSGSDGSGSTSGGNDSASSTATKATATQSVGVVDINTELGYQSAEAAGTGIVLTSSGEILTNNHVVRGSTKITVTVVSTGKTYSAKVVGTDVTDDVAVLRLSGASGLATAKITSNSASVGDSVVAVGNAGGTGGTPSAAAGQVVALGQSITATDSDGSDAENLTDLIETNADVQAGDSGGPLYNGNGSIIGMDTAASSSDSSTFNASPQSYAIPITKALSIATQIVEGKSSSTIHIGDSPFLGVQLSATAADGSTSSGSGLAVAGVVDSGPAAKAGIVAGDAITAVNGKSISSADDLTSALADAHPGDSVTVTWTDASGSSHRTKITLATGPAI
ncbi:S1-C subfamily serine protease [Jatrophihabitans sp. GAS493]|uniref:S1C family serine protease n=1 Tax=Jatrophihabitans sp. GAS493 TaxID=1907575 RepID=UPI000BB89D8B|nr:trypsin-like peptidase domain-containing protein [Jatrophihabitans sp. GAS493]SOD74228.1 S1-C subfamily serine protease [Jatrophihabitans sp. GAS493]